MSNHPKRKSTMARIDESNSAPTSSKRHRQSKSNESPDITDDSKISTKESENTKSSTPFPLEDFPTEIFNKIIEFVPVMQWGELERVDQTFRAAVIAAWGSLKKIDIQRDFLPCQRMKSDGEAKVQKQRIDILKILVQRAPKLIDIAVGCSTIMNIRDIITQLVKFKNLQRIDIGKNCLTTSSMSRFLRESASRGQLKEIGNIYAAIRPSHSNKDHLSIAFDNTNNVKQLRLETIDFALPSTELPLQIPGNFLAMVDVSRLTTFRVLDTGIPQSFLIDFLERSPQLRQLSFDFGGPCTHQPALLGAALAASKRIISAVARMDGLESLIMDAETHSASIRCVDFGQQLVGLFAALGQRPSFKELGLMGQLTSYPALINFIAAAIPKVESLKLDISELNNSILDAIFLPQSNLRKLHVHAVRNSPGTNSFNIINHVMQNAPTLESLILELPSRMFSRIHLKALGGLKALRELNLDAMDENMDDAVLEAWCDGFGANLTTLEIKNCGPHITGDAVVNLIDKSPDLKTLIVGNYSISDHTVERMAALSPRIDEFGFDCTNATETDLQNVIDAFPDLKTLHLKMVGRRLKKNISLNYGKYRVINLHECHE